MLATIRTACRYLAPVVAPLPPSVQDTSLLFRLPLELREQIYSDFFADHTSSPLYISSGENPVLAGRVTEGTHHTALLCTCKAVHAEALPILYGTHNVNLLMSDPRILNIRPSPRSVAPIVYLPQTPVCSRSHMLQLLQHRIKHVTITVRLTTVSPHTLIVQKVAWLIEMLRRRESKLKHLTLHVLDNLPVSTGGCCDMTEYVVGWRWDVYPESTLVETSHGGDLCGVGSPGGRLLAGCAEGWVVLVSVNEGRLAMGQDAQGHWKRLEGDLCEVRRVLEENKRWWKVTDPADVWDSISEDGFRFY